MSKAIVIYNTRGGNTKKVATKIAEGLGADLINQRKIPNLKDYDLVVLGTWVLAANISPGGKKYLNKLDSDQLKGKKIAMFISAAGPDEPPLGKGPEAGIIKNLVFEQFQKIFKDKGLEVVNERLAITGAFRFFRFGPGSSKKGFPDEKGLEEAKKFGVTLKKYLK